MLAEFEQAKRELARIKQELSGANKDSAYQGPEGDFLKARTLDLLKDIYGDSGSALDHIKRLFEAPGIESVGPVIDRALNVAPPLRRALSSEEDSRTVVALIDAAVWRSRVVLGAGALALAAVVVIGITIGIDVSGLNQQAEVVRKFFDQAKARSDELERQAAEFERNRKEIGARIEEMQKSLTNDSELNKLVGSFAAKLAQMKEIEQGWDNQRAGLVNALSSHQIFLSNKETEVTQQTSALLRHANNEVSAIEQSGQAAKSQQGDITGLLDSSKRANEALKAAAVDAGTDAQKIGAFKQQAEVQLAEIDKGAGRIKTLQQESEGARGQIETIKTAIDKRSAEVDAAATTAATAIDTAGKDYTRKATESLTSIDSLRSNAADYARTVERKKDDAIKQQQNIEQLLAAAGQQETEITSKLEAIKTEQAKQKGELDRATLQLEHANGIIKIVEDKRTEVGDKLRQMLGTAPNLDFATAWKLVWASRMLLGLTGAVVFLLVLNLVLTIALIWARRPRRETTDSQAAPIGAN